MKEMSKVKIYMKKSLTSILLERKILSTLHYSLIANLNFSFQDREYLYLILDYLPGGDLRYYINNNISFNESQIKFMISNLILSLRYIHNNNIIHRDIKPENLIFDDKGYLYLTDFGIARKIRNGKPILANSGTPGYISPEVLLKKPQNFSSDFFSVGVICYELLMGKKPFKGKDKKSIAEKILYKNIKLTKKKIPKNFSTDICDFINKLLKRNPEERLGNESIDEIISHPWLEGIDWDIIENKLVDNNLIPFIPPVEDNFDANHANKKENIDTEKYDIYLAKINDSGIFNNFYYNYFTFNVITKCKIIYEKSSNSPKITSISEGKKSNLSENEIEPESNNDKVDSDNNNISNNNNKTTEINNYEANKTDIKNETDFPRKSKTNKIKANTTLKRRIIGHEKNKLNEMKISNLFAEFGENDNND